MSRTTVFPVQVQFGDCDPAGIVFFPNFSRWMDASSLHFFMSCGLPPWRELEKARGIVGTPLLDIHTRFVQSATYGDRLEVHTGIEEWRGRVFIHRHRVLRGDTLICEGTETRTFVMRNEEGRLKSIALPDDLRALCS